jgi:S1-C subfamily serine protease
MVGWLYGQFLRFQQFAQTLWGLSIGSPSTAGATTDLGPVAKRQGKRFLRLTVTLLALVLLSGAVESLPAVAQVRQPGGNARRSGLERALKATVLVLVPDNNGDLLSSGSGTILDAQRGMILTNYHVLGNRQTGELYNDKGLAVIGLMPANLKGSPVLRYRAELLGGDPELDLAVLQITALFDDPRAELPADLGLTAIEVADSEDLMIGDSLYVIGYPGLGGNTVTMSTGLVSGFLDQNNDGVFEWIKTDAEVNRGNSGGLAVNEEWKFIGVPSAGVSEIETAGKISLIRTGNLALDFYQAVLLGKTGRTRSDGPRISNVQFGEAVTRRNEVIRPGMRFDSGLSDLYASFAYEGFRDGQELNSIWYINGRQDLVDSFAWSEGESGRSWVSIYNEEGLPDGFYELELQLDGESLYRGGVTIGEQQQATGACRFGPIIFAADINDAGEPVNTGQRFGPLQRVYAFFPVEGVTNGTPWRTVWYYQGQSVLDEESLWDLGAARSQWVSLSHPDGLPAGEFALELYCNGELQQRGEFQISPSSSRGRDDNQIEVIGTVTDRANSRRRIEGALVVFLLPGVSIDDWIAADFSDSLVHASGTSDRNGDFRLNAKVTPGQSYSVVAVHDRYEPVGQDDFPIPADAHDPYVLDVTMEQK